MSETPDARKQSSAFDIGSSEHILEGNWEWLRAEGFRPYETLSPEEVEQQRHVSYHRQRLIQLSERFGESNVRRGDVYDADSDRPLRHKPGMTIYVREEPPADSRDSGEART